MTRDQDAIGDLVQPWTTRRREDKGALAPQPCRGKGVFPDRDVEKG